ncbi:MAG TPA: DEAD/DEAH box helicase, partial [Terriglobales bacterium]|nr:DEAD/DEAH box helicase [Terriglobales bacterium]
DPAAIQRVCEEAWLDVRDADELADALHTLIALPEDFVQPGGEAVSASWTLLLESLREQGRAVRASVGEQTFWVGAERVATFRALFPAAAFEQAQIGDAVQPPVEDAALALATGWMSHLGPTTAAHLASVLRAAQNEVGKALLRLEASGAILRGNFTSDLPWSEAQPQWCERRLLARIHRLTVSTLRKQIEPVTAAQFMRWLLEWQHVAPGTQALGDERGTFSILRQMQGFEIPASAWERDILARRIAKYDPKILDQLSLTGAVGWGRLSPHPATLEDSSDGRRRVIPTSVAPITFFAREDADWMMPLYAAGEDLGRGLGAAARDVLAYLRSRGASFFTDIVRDTGKLKSEVETALWELVAAGLITADGFDNLRALIDPKRRSGQGTQRSNRPRHSSGRWALLHTSPHAHSEAERARALEATCKVLLDRYGVVFRDLLARETLAAKWRDLLIAFRRLEARGEVRGGRFVSGFTGEQFGLPIAVESLRAMRNREPQGQTVTLSAADPLNLIGIILPGERVPAISGRYVSYRDGVPGEPNLRPLQMAALS